MVSLSRAEPPRSIAETRARPMRPRETSEQIEESITELARRLLPGTAFHLAGFVFVEVRMPRADQLPHALVVSVFVCMLAIRLGGIFLGLAHRTTVRHRLLVMAIGSIGTNLVWGVRTAAVHLHTGASEPSILMLVIMCGLSTGAMTAYAPSLWVQRAAQSVMFLPVVAAIFFGSASGSLAVLHAMFFVYILGRGRVAHRDYWDSVHINESLRRHAESAQRAAADTDAANLQLRSEIAHRAKVEVELRQAQKLEAIGRLAAGIAHEINTPLQFITDSCRFLGDGADELVGALDDYRRVVGELADGQLAAPAAAAALADVDADRDLDYLRRQLPDASTTALAGLERVGKIVTATTDYAHPEFRDKTLADINKAVESTIILSSNETRYVADVETELGALPLIACHTGQLNQAILNIVVNAAHAIRDVVGDTGARGKIRIATWVDPGWARISISDTGTGIPADILDKIFEPFFTTKPVGTGSGQGLATARTAIVRHHGGTLDVRSELGAGATFTISLPLGDPHGPRS
jgi:signal transduction histidine kinase